MNLKTKKILVTGGTGFLGSNLIAHLVKDRGIPAGDINAFYLEGTPTDALKDIEGLNFFPGNVLLIALFLVSQFGIIGGQAVRAVRCAHSGH